MPQLDYLFPQRFFLLPQLSLNAFFGFLFSFFTFIVVIILLRIIPRGVITRVVIVVILRIIVTATARLSAG